MRRGLLLVGPRPWDRLSTLHGGLCGPVQRGPADPQIRGPSLHGSGSGNHDHVGEAAASISDRVQSLIYLRQREHLLLKD
jgi:hypothetical protein